MRTGLAMLGFTLLAVMVVSDDAATIVVNFLFAGVIPGSNARVEPLLFFLGLGLVLTAFIIMRSLYHYFKKINKSTKKQTFPTRRFTRFQV